MLDFSVPENSPNKNDNKALWDIVIDEIKSGDIVLDYLNEEGIKILLEYMGKRNDFGIRKYSTPLQASNGRNPFRDYFEEMLDAVVYIRQIMEENKENYVLYNDAEMIYYGTLFTLCEFFEKFKGKVGESR